jgi:hypothetical protein
MGTSVVANGSYFGAKARRAERVHQGPTRHRAKTSGKTTWLSVSIPAEREAATPNFPDYLEQKMRECSRLMLAARCLNDGAHRFTKEGTERG